MTTSYESPCGFMGCDPVKGQCIGFCNNGMPVQMHEPVDSYFDFPEAEVLEEQDVKAGMQMLAYTMLAPAAAALLAAVLVVVSMFF